MFLTRKRTFNLSPALGESSSPNTTSTRSRRPFGSTAPCSQAGGSACPASSSCRRLHSHGYCLSLGVELEQPVDPRPHRLAALSGEHLDVVLSENDPPQPYLSSAGQDDILLRIRSASTGPSPSTRYWIWAAFDNLKLSSIHAIACAGRTRQAAPAGHRSVAGYRNCPVVSSHLPTQPRRSPDAQGQHRRIMSPFRRPAPFLFGALLYFSALPVQVLAQALVPFVPDPHTPGLHLLPENYGGYSGDFLRGGLGLVKPLPEKDSAARSGAGLDAQRLGRRHPRRPRQTCPSAASGCPLTKTRASSCWQTAASRCGSVRTACCQALFSPGANDKDQTGDWHFLAATYSNGAVRFFVDGKEAAHDTLHGGPVRPDLELAPVDAACSPTAVSAFRRQNRPAYPASRRAHRRRDSSAGSSQARLPAHYL